MITEDQAYAIYYEVFGRDRVVVNRYRFAYGKPGNVMREACIWAIKDKALALRWAHYSVRVILTGDNGQRQLVALWTKPEWAFAVDFIRKV